MAFPTSEDKIVAAETALGRRFPNAHRDRLLIKNGGDVSASDDDWSLYPVRDASDRKRLSRTTNDIVTATVSAREWRGFPSTAVAIAENGSGDLLILQNGSDDIFQWYHEAGAIHRISVEWIEGKLKDFQSEPR